MTSRGVRFASSRDAYADDDGTYALDGSFGDQRRPSLNTAIEATLRSDWPTHLQNHNSNHNNNSNSRRTSTDSSQPSAAMATHVAVATHGTICVQQSSALWKSIFVPASPPQFRPCPWLELSDIHDWTLVMTSC